MHKKQRWEQEAIAERVKAALEASGKFRELIAKD
jgi:hypothetical protein